MTANDVIESYVRDVARYLPRAKRNDVAFELRALLHDELAAKAETEGRTPSPEAAIALLTGFGRPAEVAARYEPREPLIDPTDNHSFFIWTLVGLLVVALARPESKLAVFQWVGLLFVCFAGLGWLRRRHVLDRLRWRPKKDRYPANARRSLALVCGCATLVFPFAMYLAPRTWWELVSLGRGASGGLVLTEPFLSSWQRGATLLALLAVVSIYGAVAVQGGWREWSRRSLVAAYLLVGTLFVIHATPMVTLLDRQAFSVFRSAETNGVAMPIFALVGGLTVLAALYEAYAEWARVRPAPAVIAASTT